MMFSSVCGATGTIWIRDSISASLLLKIVLLNCKFVAKISFKITNE